MREIVHYWQTTNKQGYVVFYTDYTYRCTTWGDDTLNSKFKITKSNEVFIAHHESGGYPEMKEVVPMSTDMQDVAARNQFCKEACIADEKIKQLKREVQRILLGE